MPDRKIIETISSYYPLQISKAYNNNSSSIKALELIAKGLRDVYRYFEPAFFSGNFFMCKHFNDELCFSKEKGIMLYDKNVLLNRIDGTIIIQILEDNSFFLWEAEDPNTLMENPNVLSYHFHSNCDNFWANGQIIDATISHSGSRYAPQFLDLMKALESYKTDRILHSSCNTFAKSWFDTNRIIFKSEGSGNNVPEKHMQESLFEYLRMQDSLRGISMDAVREYNVEGSKPKPVDIRIQWREANRLALIEIKWVGSVKTKSGKINSHTDNRVNSGYLQLKGYYDSAKRDLPSSIIKSCLVVIDGRRKNVNDTTVTISYPDGMHFQNVEITIDSNKRFYDSIPGFEKPIRMFASPICI